ncbi:MAG: hypothetical protein HQK53_11090 [Oligoflexia bacterium]|nr:hypothetical protein [Oligoflexia bacterium]
MFSTRNVDIPAMEKRKNRGQKKTTPNNWSDFVTAVRGVALVYNFFLVQFCY